MIHFVGVNADNIMKILIFFLLLCSSAAAYDYDPNDFAASPTISNCVFRNCWARGQHGADGTYEWDEHGAPSDPRDPPEIPDQPDITRLPEPQCLPAWVQLPTSNCPNDPNCMEYVGWPEPSYDTIGQMVADDFDWPAGIAPMAPRGIVWWGSFVGYSDANTIDDPNIIPDGFNIRIWSDSTGLPKTSAFIAREAPIGDLQFFNSSGRVPL